MGKSERRPKRSRRFEILCTPDEFDAISTRGAQATGNVRKLKAWARAILIGRRTPDRAGSVPRARVVAFAAQVHQWALSGETDKIARLADTVLEALQTGGADR